MLTFFDKKNDQHVYLLTLGSRSTKSSSILGFPGPTLNNVFFFFFFVRLSFTSKCYISGCNKCGKQVKMETPFGLV